MLEMSAIYLLKILLIIINLFVINFVIQYTNHCLFLFKDPYSKNKKIKMPSIFNPYAITVKLLSKENKLFSFKKFIISILLIVSSILPILFLPQFKGVAIFQSPNFFDIPFEILLCLVSLLIYPFIKTASSNLSIQINGAKHLKKYFVFIITLVLVYMIFLQVFKSSSFVEIAKELNIINFLKVFPSMAVFLIIIIEKHRNLAQKKFLIKNLVYDKNLSMFSVASLIASEKLYYISMLFIFISLFFGGPELYFLANKLEVFTNIDFSILFFNLKLFILICFIAIISKSAVTKLRSFKVGNEVKMFILLANLITVFIFQ